MFGGKQRVIEFRQNPKGLYFSNTVKHRAKELVLANTVKENEKKYTNGEMLEVKKVQ